MTCGPSLRSRKKSASPRARRAAAWLASFAAFVLATGSARSPLHEANTEEILNNYTFVADFRKKPPTRKNSDKLFWDYPFPLPKVEFEILPKLSEDKGEIPPTKGGGRAIAHMNRGRNLYLEGKYEKARATFLSARARYGKKFRYHRRNDYYTAYSMLGVAQKSLEAGGGYGKPLTKGAFSNAASFLSWAFIKKKQEKDPLVEKFTPKGLYNLAAIYWRYERYAGAYGAAKTGLNFLRHTGRKDFRPRLHRFLAESHIKNHSFLEAVQQFDTAIRQDPEPSQAAAMFARVGDIYFSLNNYELAEDVYGLGARIDEEMKRINPSQLILRGESLFWLGRFDAAQKMLHYGLEGGGPRKVRGGGPAPKLKAYAALRIADAYLAKDEREKAALEYYKVEHEHKGTQAGRVAAIRRACLELPEYGGNNVSHARELLEEVKAEQGDLPEPAVELAWACQVASYTERERTPEMLERVRQFARQYPRSQFLQSFVDPVREFQAEKIKPLLEEGRDYAVVSFFEKNREMLFPKLSDELKAELFEAYVDIFKPEKAAPFWTAHRKKRGGDLKRLREAVAAAELAGGGDPWARRNAYMEKALPKNEWSLGPSTAAQGYITRILGTSVADDHLPWLFNLVKGWGAEGLIPLCDYEYTVSSRLYQRESKAARENVKNRVAEIIRDRFPKLLEENESCAISFLELEAKIFADKPAALASRYLARQDWPLRDAFLHLYWTISEKIHGAGAEAQARQMWRVIRDKAPKGSPEVRFAKARLEKRKTEFEKLWQ